MLVKQPETYIHDIVDWLKIDGTFSHAKLSWKASVIVAFFSYAMLIVYGNGCPDALCEGLHVYTDAEWALACGRWATRYMNYTTGDVVIPLINVTVNTLCIWLSCMAICKLWKIKTKLSVAMLPIVMVVTPATIAQTMYMYMLDAWGLSTLFGVLFVYVVLGNIAAWKKILIAPVLLAVSLGLYQSVVSVISLLFVFSLILQLLENEDFKQIFRDVWNFIVAIVLGGIEYSVIMKLQIGYYGGNLADRVTTFSVKNILLSLPSSVYDCYYAFAKYFSDGIMHHKELYLIVFTLMACCFATLAWRMLQEKAVLKSSLAILLFALIPVCANVIKILIPYNEISLLMEYQYIFIWPFLFALLERVNDRSLFANAGRLIGYLLAAAIAFSYVVCANATYISYNLSYQHLYFETNGILNKVYDLPEYTEGDTIVFAGFIDDDFLRNSIKTYRYAYGLTENVAYWEDGHGLNVCRYRYLQNYFGVDAKMLDREKYNSIIKSEEYLEMGIYPAKDSIKKIDNMIFVKLSETVPTL